MICGQVIVGIEYLNVNLEINFFLTIVLFFFNFRFNTSSLINYSDNATKSCLHRYTAADYS